MKQQNWTPEKTARATEIAGVTGMPGAPGYHTGIASQKPIDQAELDALVAELRNLRAQREAIEAEEEAIKDLLKEYLSNQARTELRGPDYKITWSFAERTSINAKELAAQHPDIATKFMRTTRYRVFSLK